MYLEYWGLREEPFKNTPDWRFLYPSKNHQSSLQTLQYGLSSEKGAAMLTGEYGCGKTVLTRAIANTLHRDKYEIALINCPFFDRDNFLKEVCFQFGQDPGDVSISELFRRLSQLFFDNLTEGRKNILIIDEGQIIDDSQVFEEIRLLLNIQLEDRFLINLLLVGQPELREKIMQYPQLDQRIALKCHLHRFDRKNTANYVQHRLQVAGSDRDIFGPEVLYQIHRISNGVPRRINNIADLCLLEGANRKVRQIDEQILKCIS
jgi:general secretion pathway protein A